MTDLKGNSTYLEELREKQSNREIALRYRNRKRNGSKKKKLISRDFTFLNEKQAHFNWNPYALQEEEDKQDIKRRDRNKEIKN